MYDLAPTLVVIGAAALFLPYLDPQDGRARVALFGISILLTWRYVVWRFTATIPPFAPTIDSLYPWGFALVEAAASIGWTLCFVTLSRTGDRSAEATRWRPALARRPPRVDLLITTYNEEESILRRTIVGALAVDFPALRVWVLDDGRRPWLARLCEKKGVRYVARPDNRHAKAGNINHGLAVMRADPDPAEFVALFDADFVPHPNFLWRTMPLFHAPDVAVVQTPQHFFNNDPIQFNLLIGPVWPDQQRFFFDHMMVSKDAWGAAFCCGTASVIRAAALEQIGGFPTDSVTEDFLLTLRLDRAGWRTVYLNERLSTGLAPEGVTEYVTQRGRWCLGLMQILRSSLGPLSRGRLSIGYRLGLLDASLYWAATFSFRLLGFAAPIVYWFAGLTVIDAPAGETIRYFLPYYAGVIITLGWATRGLIRPVLTDVTQVLTMGAALKATVVGLVRPRNQPFKVTRKGGRRDRPAVQWQLVVPFALLAGLTVAGMLYASLSDFTPVHLNAAARPVALFWSIYNVVVLLLAISVCIELPRYRREERFPTAERVRVYGCGRAFSAPLADLSVGGARIRASLPAPVGTRIRVDVAGAGMIPARIAYGGERMFAVEFTDDRPAQEALIRKLFGGKYGRPPRQVRSGGLLRALFLRALR
jgi:cellulose synthase (UDP-forming)